MIPFLPIGVTAEDNSDPTILWDATPLSTVIIDPDGSVFNNLYFYEQPGAWPWARAGYWEWQDATYAVPHIDHWFNTGEYLVKYDLVSVVSGSADMTINYTTGQEGVWFDLWRQNIELDDTTADSTFEHQIVDITIATDDGGGSPVAGTEKTKRVTFISYRGSGEYVAYDRFTGTNGTALTAHTMNVDPGGGWADHAGAFAIQSNQAKAPSGTDIRAVFDAGIADCAMFCEINFNGSDAGLIFRAADASNYWEFVIIDGDTANPVVQINEIVSGSPTTRASQTMTGKGPMPSTQRFLSVICDGDDIWCRAIVTYDADGVWELTHNSSSMNTETLFGIRAYDTAPLFDDIWISDLEIGVIT